MSRSYIPGVAFRFLGNLTAPGGLWMKCTWLWLVSLTGSVEPSTSMRLCLIGRGEHTILERLETGELISAPRHGHHPVFRSRILSLSQLLGSVS